MKLLYRSRFISQISSLTDKNPPLHRKNYSIASFESKITELLFFQRRIFRRIIETINLYIEGKEGSGFELKGFRRTDLSRSASISKRN